MMIFGMIILSANEEIIMTNVVQQRLNKSQKEGSVFWNKVAKSCDGTSPIFKKRIKH